MKRLVVFASISTLGASIDFALAYALIRFAETPGWAALASAMLVSASVVYLLHAKLTFADRADGAAGAGGWASFLTLTAAVYALRVAAFEALGALGAPLALALALALALSAALTFTLSSLLIFKAPRR